MNAPRRFYVLDNLRGIAALCVVLWHYQHFFFVVPGQLHASFARETQPLYSLFAVGYEYGFHAVQLFFVLSGFVFFFKYLEALREKRLGAWDFFVLRFSRLYPLHFATLVLVAALQALAYYNFHASLIYPNNDPYHFVLQLFFASEWGLQNGASFNGPTWSVSIEVLLYAMFFVFAAFAIPRTRYVWPSAIAVIVGAYALQRFALSPALGLIANSAGCFFLGGLAFSAWQETLTMTEAHSKTVLALLALAVSVALAVYAFIWSNARLLHYAVFPGVILVLAMCQTQNSHLGTRTQLIGDISYSTYLLHVPLQLIVLLTIKLFQIPIDFHRPGVLVSYLVLIILISSFSYYRFELPMQRALRRRYLGRVPAVFARQQKSGDRVSNLPLNVPSKKIS